MSQRSNHRWPLRALSGDLVRGGIALLCCLAFLLTTRAASIAFVAGGALTLLFGLYFAESLARVFSHVEIDEGGIRVKNAFFGLREIKWDALSGFELRHFALSRGATKGWMDVKLTSGKTTILLDERLDGFDVVLRRVWEAAQLAGIGITETSLANLQAAGLIADKRAS